MKFYLKICRFGIFVILFTVVFGLLGITQTVYADESNCHIKVEVSRDGGATWYNYQTNPIGSGNSTLYANPGDSILIRLKGWYDADVELLGGQADGYITINNTVYIANPGVSVNLDSDGDAVTYNPAFFTSSSAIGMLAVLDGNATESDCVEKDVITPGPPYSKCQMMRVGMQLGNNFPVGETIITGTVYVTNYTERQPVSWWDRLNLFGKARAQGNINSTFRISVNVAGAQTLPATGADIQQPKTLPNLLSLIPLVIIASGLLILKFRKNIN